VSSERRATPRVRLPLEVAVDGAPAELLDLSAGGVALLGDAHGRPGEPAELTLPLPDRAPPLVARAQVVRAVDGRTAYRLVSLTVDERQRVDRFVFTLGRLPGRPG
jgi:hypothetical protein